jgi:hypothetical protein
LELGTRLPELPEHSREAVEQELTTLDFLETQIESAEQRLEAIMKVSVEADVLKTLPCVTNGSNASRIIRKRWSPWRAFTPSNFSMEPCSVGMPPITVTTKTQRPPA